MWFLFVIVLLIFSKNEYGFIPLKTAREPRRSAPPEYGKQNES